METSERKYHIEGDQEVVVIRYINNVFTDNDKQKAIMLFLGDFNPAKHHQICPLWDDLSFKKWTYT